MAGLTKPVRKPRRRRPGRGQSWRNPESWRENPARSTAWVQVVFRRRLLVILLLAVQAAVAGILVGGSSRQFRSLSWGLVPISFIVSLYILNKKEKPAYKLTWIMLILVAPVFGGIFYIIFTLQSNSRKLKRDTKKIDAVLRPLFLLPGDALPGILAEHKDCAPQVRYLQEFAGFPVYRHTKTEFFPSGETFFARLLPELEKAEKYIFMEFFILEQGQMLDPIIGLLERKAKAGLDVRLIYDDLGCFLSLPANFHDELEKKGIKCMVFNPFKPIWSSYQNNRDHRKIVSIDGKAAFTGGMNIADEYINVYEKYGHWKDAGILLEGEAAWSMTLIFLHMWNLGRAQIEDAAALYPWKEEPCTTASDGWVLPYADSPMDGENVGEHVYIQIINAAKDYVYINTPYLVVDDNLISALTLAAKSGVDVRIITPHRWDKWVVRICSRSYYRQLVQAGVKVYEYSQGFNHSKTFVSDDKVATVGTTNLDFRSLYLHFEDGVWVYRSSIVAAVKEDFLATLPACHRITPEDCARNAFQRIVQDILRLFAPLM